MPDDELLALAVSREFVFVTNNHADFMGLCANAELHTGLIVLPQRPRDAQLPIFSDAVTTYCTAPAKTGKPRKRTVRDARVGFSSEDEYILANMATPTHCRIAASTPTTTTACCR